MRTSHKLTHALLALVALIVFTSSALAQAPNTPVGPGVLPGTDAMVSDQKAGSLLFYLYYTSQSTSGATVNTRINITNTNPSTSAFVHIFFIAGCVPADAFICLTPSQTMSFTALDYDPDSTGYVMAYAVDGGTATTAGTGLPAQFNWLIGDEFVKDSAGFAANFGAEAIQKLTNANVVTTDGTLAALFFDGLLLAGSYDRVGRVLAVDNFPSLLDGNSVRLVVQRVGGNLTSRAADAGSLFGVIYDEAEQLFSFTTSSTCSNPIIDFSANNPRILGGGLNQVVGIGRTGWMRFSANSDFGLLGVMLVKNSTAGTNSFSGGHTLHKLTLTGAATLVVPIFTPSC